MAHDFPYDRLTYSVGRIYPIDNRTMEQVYDDIDNLEKLIKREERISRFLEWIWPHSYKERR